MSKYPHRTVDVNNHVLSTLAAGAAILTTTKVDASRLNGMRPRKLNYGVSLVGLTDTEGPLIYGICADLTATEVGSWFSADPQSRLDEVEIEKSQRRIQVLGHLARGLTRTNNDSGPMNSRQTRKAYGWKVLEGTVLSTFVLNADVAALTTGCEVTLEIEILGDWLDD